jgi:glycosyltransferase involved in cell wall biosynthesis
LKVVIAHEWLTNVAGSEKVLLQMAQAFPDAEIVVGVADPKLAGTILPGRRVRSLLSPNLPGILTKWSRYAPLLWFAWRFTKLRADVLIVSSHFAAHQVCHRATGKTIVYYHTPMRMAWKFDMEKARVSRTGRMFIAALLPVIQYLDRLPSKKASRRLANSAETQRRIKDFYGQDSQVIHPPVNTSEMPTGKPMGQHEYYLCLGRLVEYKRVDEAILACNSLGRRLVVAGKGPAERYLRALAGPSIEFIGHVEDRCRIDLLANARALIFPGLEDFGIVPVEAMSVGTPVIALGEGGVVDTVNADTGFLYRTAGAAALAEAILAFEGRAYDPLTLARHADQFNEANFRRLLGETVAQEVF